MSKGPFIIIGAGGHAKVLIESLQLHGCDIIGIVSPDSNIGEHFYNIPILGNDEAVLKYSPNEIYLVNGIGSLPNYDLRWGIAKKFRNLNYIFPAIIHKYAIVSSYAHLEEGVQIMAGAVIQAGTKIMMDTIINTGALVDHDCCIGKNCHIAPGCTISGGVTIADNVHLGTGSNVIQGICISNDAVIAAGSTVYKNVEADTLVKQKVEYAYEKR